MSITIFAWKVEKIRRYTDNNFYFLWVTRRMNRRISWSTSFRIRKITSKLKVIHFERKRDETRLLSKQTDKFTGRRSKMFLLVYVCVFTNMGLLWKTQHLQWGWSFSNYFDENCSCVYRILVTNCTKLDGEKRERNKEVHT